MINSNKHYLVTPEDGTPFGILVPGPEPEKRLEQLFREETGSEQVTIHSISDKTSFDINGERASYSAIMDMIHDTTDIGEPENEWNEPIYLFQLNIY